MLHIQAVLVHSKAVTAAEKSSGLPDNQPSLQLPESVLFHWLQLTMLVYVHYMKIF